MRRTSLCCNCLPRVPRRLRPGRLASVLRPLAPLRVFAARSRLGRVLPESLPRERRFACPNLLGLQEVSKSSGYKLRATAPKTAPEEISACYGSSTGHKPSTEPTSAARGPLTGEIGLAMSMGCESLR